MDFTLSPLLNAAALNHHHGIEQLIGSPPAAAAAAAAAAPASSDSDNEEPPVAKKPKKKHSSATNARRPDGKFLPKTNTIATNYLNHPESDTHKLQTNQQLLDTASRIEDAISELLTYADLLAADGLKLQHRQHNSRSASAANIRLTIVPLLQITANTLRDAGKCFAPYRGTERLFERNDLERKRNMMDAAKLMRGPKKSDALMMIDGFIQRSNWSPPPNESITEMCTSSSKKRKASASEMILLQPRNGSTYTKSEAVAIVKQYKKGEKGRRKIIEAMYERGFIPVHPRNVDRLIKKLEEGKICMDDEWRIGAGRPSITYPDHMKPKPIDCNLTFEDLDTGDNRIVVEVDWTKKKEEYEEEDEEVMVVDDDDHSTKGGDAKQPHQKKKKKPAQKPGSLPRKKKELISPKVIAFQLPPPRDGSKVYTKNEFVEVIKSFVPTKQHHIATKAAMYRGYVGKATKRSLTTLMEKSEKGEQIFDTEWTAGRVGRPPAISPDEINAIVERIQREDLRVHDNDDVNQLLVDALRKKGVVDQKKLTFCSATIADYFTVLKSKLSPLYWKKVDKEEDDNDDE
ncbi:hypothetical protein ACHAWT_001408 [Skeletonema menzelii]